MLQVLFAVNNQVQPVFAYRLKESLSKSSQKKSTNKKTRKPRPTFEVTVLNHCTA